MNALTASDWTAYPFASECRKDFGNLMDVYLDAVFFPHISPMDFSQEGWRLEFDPADSPDGNLMFKGVVFNEMKGAMSSPLRVLSELVGRHLFPGVTYRFNSGGDPETIPSLTWEQLKQFHETYYHPSNAIFMTYGDIPAARHQEVFQQRVLHRFTAQPLQRQIGDENRFSAPVQVEERYAIDEEDTHEKTQILISWLLGRSASLEDLLKAQFLSGVLLDNSSSPLLHRLETCGLGKAPSSLCGLDDSIREMVFSCGLEGSEPEHADAVERLVFDLLEQIAREGVEPERLEAVLHQLEISRREIGGDGLPYGLKLMLNALPAAIHGGDPVALLNLDPVLERMRAEIATPERARRFIQELARTWLVENPHRVRIVMRPDPALSAQKQQREKDRLAEIARQLSDAERQQIVERAALLKQRQEEQDNVDLLPKVELSDVPPTLTIPACSVFRARPLVSSWYDQPTNGLVYQQLVIGLPDLTAEEITLLPLLASCITEVGCGDRDYMAQQAWQSAICGGISAFVTARNGPYDATSVRGHFVLSSKALYRNQGAMAELLRDTLLKARFDEMDRLRELISQMRTAAEMRVTDHGHVLAMSLASSGHSSVAHLLEQWSGLTAVRRLKELDTMLSQDTAPMPAEVEYAPQHRLLQQRLEALRDRLVRAPREFLVVSEGNQFPLLSATVEQLWQEHPAPVFVDPGCASRSLTWPGAPGMVRAGWTVSATQVHFCAKSYPIVAYAHDDAPALLVLGPFLKNGFLHRAIREQGGAYGSGASADLGSGTFRFFSYRDPRLGETLDVFEQSLHWLQEHRHEPRTLEEAILGVVGSIDRPGSPAGEAKKAFYDALYGRTAALRQRIRQRVMEVTLEDLQRVARTWLTPERASVAVVSHVGSLEERTRLGLTNDTL
jgi:Zn-dependent M16 (insulinase) family peptidase